MRRPRHLMVVLVTGLALAGAPTSASANTLEMVSEGANGTVDMLVLRPLGLARLALGSLVFLPISSVFNAMGLPFGKDTSVFKDDFDRMVVEPAEYTFSRPIGQDLAGG